MSASIFTNSEGNTPIGPDEIEDLIPNLATRLELNEWERDNIIRAERWCFSPKVLKKFNPISEVDLRSLHRRMFDATWKWAGTYRKTEKTIGVPVVQINTAIASLLGDAEYWIKERPFDCDEIAIRFHHKLVLIHPFPNGNGRHSRLISDVLAVQLGCPRFTWGRANLQTEGGVRDRYISALKCADLNDIMPLIAFARS
jgi:Fic-DOC domain mobile mystery protein B